MVDHQPAEKKGFFLFRLFRSRHSDPEPHMVRGEESRPRGNQGKRSFGLSPQDDRRNGHHSEAASFPFRHSEAASFPFRHSEAASFPFRHSEAADWRPKNPVQENDRKISKIPQLLITKQKINQYLEKLKSQGSSEATIKRKEASLAKFADWVKREYGHQEEALKIVPPKPKKEQKVSLSKKAYRDSKKASPLFKFFSFFIIALLAGSLGWGIYTQFIARPPKEPSLAALPTLPPNLISFQGRLTNSVGTPIHATVSASFKIYNVDEGGTALWSETKDITTNADGIFNTLLGSSTTIDPSIFADNVNLWLGITVAGDDEMTPRQQIATVGYAYNSRYLQGYPASSSATAETIPVINADGYLVLASPSPRVESTSGTFGLMGEAITIQSTGGAGGGDILIQPDTDTQGQVIVYSGTTTDNSFAVQNSNITTGSLIYAEAGTSGTGYDLLKLSSGSPTPTTKFAVDYAGNTDIAGNLTVDSSGFFDGNVGIGTTDPGYRLDILGGTDIVAQFSGRVIGGEAVNDNEFITKGQLGNVGVTSVTGTANQITASPTIGDVVLSIPSDFRAPGTVTATTGLYTGTGAGTLRIDASGNLSSIGTISSTYLNTGASYVDLVSSAELRVGGTSVLTSSRALQNITTISTSGNITSSGGVLSMGGSGNNYFAGNVGIGQTAPAFKLQLAGSGNLLSIGDTAGNTFFSVTDSLITSNLPHTFTSSGDVSMAYNLLFTNPTASYIRSSAPLYIEAGEAYGSSDLTLRTYNTGNIILESANLWADGSSVGIGTTTPGHALEISGDFFATGAFYDSAESAGSSGNILQSTGVGTSWVSLSSLSVGNADTLDNLDSTDFLRATASDTFEVGNTLTVAGTLSAIGNAYFGNLSGIWDSAGNVGIGTTDPGSYKLSVAGTANISTSLTTPLIIGSSSLGLRPAGDSTTAIQLQNAAGTSVLNVDTTNGRVGIGTTDPGSPLEVNGDILATSFSIGSSTLGSTEFGYLDGQDQSVLTSSAVTFADVTITTPSNIYNLSHDSFADYLANEHIDWTNASSNFSTSGSGYFGSGLNVGIGLTTPAFTMVTGAGANKVFTSDASGNASWEDLGTVGGVTGTGTEHYLPIWLSGGSSLGDSSIYESGNNVGIGGTAPATSPSLYVGADGNVGVGTTSPNNYKLNVNGNIYVGGTANFNSYVGIGVTNPTYPFSVKTSNVDRFNILSGGNIHIGSYPNYNLAKLHILSGDVAGGTVSSNTFLIESPSPSMQLYSASTGTASLYLGQSDTKLEFNEDSDIMGFQIGGSMKMTIDSSGNVGIGTNAPSYKLDVNGDIGIASGSDLYIGSVGIGGTAGAGIVGMNDAGFTYVSATNVQDALSDLDSSISSLSGDSGWYLSGDTGTAEFVGIGNTASFVGGSGIDTTVGATDTLTLAFDSTELGDLTWGSGSPFTWNLNVGATDPYLYSTSNTIALMNGNVGVGTTGPTQALHVIGNITSPGTGANSEKFGFGASAGGSSAVAIGRNANASGEQGTIAIGASSTASGQQSFTIGSNASATGIRSYAIGHSASNTGNDSLVIGHSASGGSNTVAVGQSSSGGSYGVAVGRSTVSGTSGVALGEAASGNTASIAIGRSANATAANIFVAGSSSYPINNIYFGKGVTDAAPTVYTLHGTSGSGTDIAGGNLQIAAGRGTGTGLGGSLIFQTAPAGTSGSGLNSVADRMAITSGGNVGIGTTNPSNFKLQVAGNVGPQADSAYNLGSDSIRWANIYADNIYGAVSGSVSFADITSGTNTQAAMVVGTGGSLDYTGSGTINASSLQGGTWGAPLGIGTTTPGVGYFTTLSASTSLTTPIIDSSGGLAIGTSSQTGLTLGRAGATTTINGSSIVLGTQASSTTHAVRADRSLTAGSGLTGGGDLTADRTFNVGAGNGISVNADDVAVNQGYNFAWTGTQSWSNTATFNGNLFFGGSTGLLSSGGNVGIGQTSPTFKLQIAGSGNLLSIGDTAGNTFFSVTDSLITSNLPHTFTSSGDVSMAYDLIFTNQTSSKIESYGPFSIIAGESHESNNLTLKTYNAGKLIVDSANFWVDSANVGIGTTSPSYTLEVAGDIGIDSGSDLYLGGVGLGSTGGAGLVGLDNDGLTYVTSSTVQGGIADLDGAISSVSGEIRWTMDGDSGTPQIVGAGQTASFVGGTGISTSVGATRQLTITNTAPWTDSSGSYIQNQFASAQTGNFWISGTGLVGTRLGIGATHPAYSLYTTGNLGVGGTAYFADRVGVGTTSPWNFLDISTGSSTNTTGLIVGAMSGASTDNDATLIGFRLRNTNNGFMNSSNLYDAGIAGIVNGTGVNRSALAFYTRQSSTAVVERMRIDYLGNVGIGTTDPGSYKLNVAGNTYLGGTLTTTGAITAPTSTNTINNLVISSGTITSGTWQATAVAPAYGGTGDNTSSTTGVPYITAGNWQYETALDETRGGTGLSAYSTGDLLYASGANTLGNLGIGTTGQVLTVSGGVPVWADAASGVSGSGASGQVTFWSGSDSISGDDAFWWDNTNKVLGIGTSAPVSGYKLDVNGNLRASKYVDTANSNYFLDPAETGVSLAVAGNVGIGTTNPTAKLTVASNGNGVIFKDGGLNDTFVFRTENTAQMTIGLFGTNSGIIKSGYNLTLQSRSNTDGGVYINAGTDVNGGVRFNIGGSEKMRVHTDGNVGIGTTNPSYKLHVNGNTYIDGALTTTGAISAPTSSNTINNLVINSGTITSGTWQATAIGATYGGTGQTAYNTGDLLYASSGTALSKRGIGTTGQVLTVSGGLPVWADPGITGSGSGSGSGGQATFWTGSDSISGDNAFWWDNTNKSLGIGGTPSSAYKLDVLTGNMRAGKFVDGSNSNYYLDPAEAVSLLTAGNAGIGTVSTDYRLDVRSGTTDNVAKFSSSDDLGQILIADNDTTAYLGAKDSKTFLGLTSGLSSNNLVIDNVGNVGVGTTDPGSKLHVYSSRSDSPADMYNMRSVIDITGAPTTVRAFDMRVNNNATSGTITNLQGQYTEMNITNNASVTDVKNYTTWGTKQGTGTVSNWTLFDASNPNKTAGAITNLYGLKIADLTAGTNNWSIYTGSAPSYFGGNVGIGVSNPSSGLHVVGADARLTLQATGGRKYFLNTSSDMLTIGRRISGDTVDAYDITIFNSGNVGIGTTNPQAKLDIGGASSTISNTSGDITINSASNNISFAGDNLINISNLYLSGNLGIGTTGPTQKTHIQTSSTGDGLLITKSGESSSLRAFMYEGLGPSLEFRNASDATIHRIRGYTGYPTFFANGGGNVGIGTSAPSGTFEVAGFMRSTAIGTIPTAGKGTEVFYHTSLDLGYVLAYDRSASAYRPLRIEGSSVQINSGSGGNVGIGTASPGEKLQVNGAILLYGNYDLKLRSSSTDPGDLVFQNSSGTEYGRVYADSTNAIRLSGGSGTDAEITAYDSGAIYFNSGIGNRTSMYHQLHIDASTWEVFRYSSSRRLKSNITDLEIDSSKIYNLRPTSFTPNDKPDIRNFGFIAEEAIEVIPELVLLEEDGSPGGFRYADLGVLILNEMIKQKPLIDTLKSDLALTETGDIVIENHNSDLFAEQSLESQISSLKSQNYSLKTKTGEIVTRMANFSEAAVAKLKTGLTETTNLIADNLIAKNITTEEKIISPVVETEQLKVKSEKLKVTDQNDQPTAEFDTENKKTTLFGDLEVAGKATAGEIGSQRGSFGNLLADNVGIGQLEAENVKTEKLEVTQDATISGTLYVDRVVAREGGFGDLLAKNISMDSIRAIVREEILLGRDPSPEAQDDGGGAAQDDRGSTEDTNGGDTNDTEEEVDIETLLAEVEGWLNLNTDSDLIVDEETIVPENQISAIADNFIHQGNLTVLGQTTMGSVFVADQLVAGQIVLADNNLSNPNGTLFLQKEGLGGLDVLNGKFMIDTDGNVFIAKHLTVGGDLMAGNIRPREGEDLIFDLANSVGQGGEILRSAQNDGEGAQNDASISGHSEGAPEESLDSSRTGSFSAGLADQDDGGEGTQDDQGGFGKLLVKGNNQETVAQIDASGSAEFSGTVRADGLAISKPKNNQEGVVIAASENFDKISIWAPGIVTNASAGEAVLPVGQTDLIVYNNRLTEESMIYLTPTSDTQNQVLYVKAKVATITVEEEEQTKTNSGYFVVGINRPINEEVKFNWWIIGNN